MADSSLIIVKELSQTVEVKQSNQAPIEIQVVTGPAGPPGPKGDPGEQGEVGPAGYSIVVYVQEEEPTDPNPGDIWLLP